jgi:hypothetical protein
MACDLFGLYSYETEPFIHASLLNSCALCGVLIFIIITTTERENAAIWHRELFVYINRSIHILANPPVSYLVLFVL